jgi:acyl carrier protein
MEVSKGRYPLLDSAAIMSCIYQCIPQSTQVTPEMSVSEAGFDSLRLSQLVLEVEARLSRELDDEDIESILLSRSIGQIVREIERVTSKD